MNFLERNLANLSKIINSMQEFKPLNDELFTQIEALSFEIDKEGKQFITK